MKSLLLSHFTATSCLGKGLSATLKSLLKRPKTLRLCDFETVDLPTYIGVVEGLEEISMPKGMHDYDCRNNRLALLAMQQDGFVDAVEGAIKQYGHGRVGVFMGTSTSGILETELAFRQRDPETGCLPSELVYRTTQNTFSVADFTRTFFQLSGPAVAVSSACSSSAKVFASARRMIESGLIDAAIVGGVDSLCLTTLYGFNALGLLSTQACRPYDGERDGISIGEGAAYVLLERPTQDTPSHSVLLLGVGESSDAHHMSSPHPDGLGAQMAMEQALNTADLQAADIDYINLHGTATPSNDTAEAKGVLAVFGNQMPCSSTKGATGHTLGAAGGLEAVICALALQYKFLPGGMNTNRCDTNIDLNYLLNNQAVAAKKVISNSFGFGGTNCSLIFGLNDTQIHEGTSS